MTKQELISTYESMSMPEERAAALEARLMKLFDKTPSEVSAPEGAPAKEYRFEERKPSAARTAAIALSAAAAVALCVVGGKFLLDRVDLTPNGPISETAETSETSQTDDFIGFDSADDLPAYESAGCYDDVQHTVSETAPQPMPDFAERLRQGLPCSVVRMKIILCTDEADGCVNYSASIEKVLAGKDITVYEDRIIFPLEGTFSEQVRDCPPLAVGDEVIALVTRVEDGELFLVGADEMLFECFAVQGQNFAAQRGCGFAELAAAAKNYQTVDTISRVTTVSDNPAVYRAIFEENELAEVLEEMVLVQEIPEEPWLDDSIPLPSLYGDFSMNFELIDPFCFYWFDENNDLVSIDCHEDIFGTVHNYESDFVPDMYCAGFCEDEQGWYMRGSNRNGGDSMYFVPKERPERMYRYDFGSDSAQSRSEYNAEYIRQGEGNWLFLDANNDGGFYANAMKYDDRAPAENYVGQISWLGKEYLCELHGETWAEEFNKWYNMGGSMTYNDAVYRREPLLAAGGDYDVSKEDYFGAGRVWLIDHSDTKIVAAMRFTSEDWINFRDSTEAQRTDSGFDLSKFASVNGAAKYFILTAEYRDGEWQESWQERNNIDAMMMQGVISPNNYTKKFYDDRFAWGDKRFTALMLEGGASELFRYNQAIDEYTKLNTYSCSKYLQSDDFLYVVGAGVGENGMYLSEYSFETGDLTAQSPMLEGGGIEGLFFSPDGKYIFVINTESEVIQNSYAISADTLEIAAYGKNTPRETQFTIDAGGFTVTKDGEETRFNFDAPDLSGAVRYCETEDGSYYAAVEPTFLYDGMSEDAEFINWLIYYHDGASGGATLSAVTGISSFAEDGDTLYVWGSTSDGSGYNLLKLKQGELTTLADEEFFKEHPPLSDTNCDLEKLPDSYLCMRFTGKQNDVWLFDPDNGEFTEQRGYYDSVFEELDLNPVSVGPPIYDDLAGVLIGAEEHYGANAQFWLCRMVRVLPEEDKLGRTVCEVQLIENLLTSEKGGKTAVLILGTGSPEVQKRQDPPYAPAELFTCAMVEDKENDCMQSVYGFRYDIQYDNGTFALSRENREIDELKLEGSTDIKEEVITSTTENPAMYTQKIPLDVLVEFVRNDWANRGIGQ